MVLIESEDFMGIKLIFLESVKLSRHHYDFNDFVKILVESNRFLCNR